MTDRFRQALQRIDALHSEDPEVEQVAGAEIPAELAYAHRMTTWLLRIAPNASEALRLAVRAQHLCRWQLARSEYPMDRAGYKAWRREQLKRHAALTSKVLSDVGYEPELVERVAVLIGKRKLQVDSETQTLEDVACLVFLEHYFGDFAKRHEDEKLVTILKRTWPKMSRDAQLLALDLPLARSERALVEAALQPNP